ncbi:methyltransferase domain-containing protein [Thalassotalea aquiviva]|uniref:methyltransferase domain-containing protein n=1 Tax=Thalassotalea aquiviva TaxID=3242415 RepID=UPI00352A2C49
MKPALAYNEPWLPKGWRDLPNGHLIAQAIEEHLEPCWPRIFGYHLLKLGALSGKICSINSLISHQVVVTKSSESADVIAEIDDLPFLQQCVDACMLNHCLEFSVDPHHVLREADRVLIPNGYMIISGYNPFSLAGLNQLIPFRRQQVPWQGRFFTPMRVKDWLHLLGYEIVIDTRFLHAGLHSEINPDTWWFKSWQNFAGKFLSPMGSIYLIVAKKRVLPLTPIRPKWKMRPNFSPIKVSTKNTSSVIKSLSKPAQS